MWLWANDGANLLHNAYDKNWQTILMPADWEPTSNILGAYAIQWRGGNWSAKTVLEPGESMLRAVWQEDRDGEACWWEIYVCIYIYI